MNVHVMRVAKSSFQKNVNKGLKLHKDRKNNTQVSKIHQYYSWGFRGNKKCSEVCLYRNVTISRTDSVFQIGNTRPRAKQPAGTDSHNRNVNFTVQNKINVVVYSFQEMQ